MGVPFGRPIQQRAGNDTLDGVGGFDTFANFENFNGSNFNDTITGNTAANTLTGNDGDDTLNGGDSNDSLLGLVGSDALNGGNGTDLAIYTYAGAAVTVNLAAGTAIGEGSDTLSGIENVNGSAFADSLTGDTAANTLRGDGDNDTINGGGGLDTLYGEAGADIFLFDTNAFSSIDVVKDFSTGSSDKFDIADLLIGYDSLTDAINDFVTSTNSGGNSQIFVDRDGSGAGSYSSVQIALLEGATSLNPETPETNGNLITI